MHLLKSIINLLFDKFPLFFKNIVKFVILLKKALASLIFPLKFLNHGPFGRKKEIASQPNFEPASKEKL